MYKNPRTFLDVEDYPKKNLDMESNLHPVGAHGLTGFVGENHSSHLVINSNTFRNKKSSQEHELHHPIQKVESGNSVFITEVKPGISDSQEVDEYSEASECCFSQGSWHANETLDEDMALFDDVIINTMKEHKIKGGSVILGHQGRILYRQGYGQESPGVLATSSSKFKIGDVSKVITAMAILRLVEQGHLQLTDEVFGDLNKSTKELYLKLSGILKDYYKGKRRLSIESRTIEHLLQHSWGVDPQQGHDIIDTRIFFANKMTLGWGNFKSLDRKEMMLKQIIVRSSDSTPGKKHSYCHLGYLLLGVVLEEVTGMPYLHYVRDMLHSLKVGEIQHIDCAEELEKENIHLKKPFDSMLCILHDQENKEYSPFLQYKTKACSCKNQMKLIVLETAAYCGIVLSAEQLFRIFSSIELSLYKSSILLRESVVKMLERPAYENGTEWYGLGLNVCDGGESWGHSGNMPTGSHSSVFRHHSGLTWAVLFNDDRSGTQNLNIDLDTMMKHALSMTPKFSSFSTLLFKQLSFLSMESMYYAVYSANMDQVYEILLPYEMLDEHYGSLKLAGFYIQRIDLTSCDGKIYVNIIWKKNEENLDWFIRKFYVDNRCYGSIVTVEKDVEQFLTSGYRIQTLATCSVRNSLHCVIVFRKKTNLKLSYKFFFFTPFDRVNDYVAYSGSKIIIQSVCAIDTCNKKLLTSVTENEKGQMQRPNKVWIAVSQNDFLNYMKEDHRGYGIKHFQFYYNSLSDKVLVSFVLSPDVKRRSVCKSGLTRYAFMKTLTDIARSTDVEVEQICSYVCKGSFFFACMMVDKEAVPSLN